MAAIDPGIIAMIVLAYGIGAVVKGAIGVGTPFVVIPMLSPLLGLPIAVAILTFPLLTANIWQIWQYRAVAREVRFLPRFVAGSAIGLGFGTYGLVTMNPDPLMVFVGLAVMAYLGIDAILPNLRIPARTGLQIAPLAGLGSGVMHGLSGISAPISLTYMAAMRLDRAQFIFAASAAFLVAGAIQLVTLSVAGVMTQQVLLMSLIASVPTMALMPLGTALGRWLSARAFRRVVLLMLFGLAIRMIYQGLFG
jgi:uncharacterized membrane protein YfcA